MTRSKPFKRDCYMFLSLMDTSYQKDNLIHRFKDRCKQIGVSVNNTVIKLIASFFDGYHSDIRAADSFEERHQEEVRLKARPIP